MILTLDIGNTNIKIGAFDGDKMVASWRVSTAASKTADEYGMIIYDLLFQKGISFEDVEA
ncbi:MAG: type III pantothenate kinase, partial [Clostridia bacterium]|nr:type III pantothenate kinase [Clostridia bacterium]